MIDREIWKDIKDYEGFYQISSYGRVRSLDRIIIKGDGKKARYSGKILSPNKDKDGYLMIMLSINSKTKRFKIHRLVAEAFIENPGNKPEVNHKNGKKDKNHVKNLEWVTDSENTIHAIKNGLRKYPKGEECGKSKLKEKDVLEICKMLNDNVQVSEIAKRYNVKWCSIYNIKKGVNWGHLTKGVIRC